jgi:hypothetical protein
MEMRNSFSGIKAIINDNAVAADAKTLLTRCSGSCGEEGSKEREIGGCGLIYAGDEAFWHNKEMNRCLRSNILKGDPFLSFSKDTGRNFSCCDFLENCQGEGHQENRC